MTSDEMNGFIQVCSVDQLRDSEGKRFLINDTDIALFRVGESVYAVNNICPHQHSALIYDGFVENEFVVCPAHGWMFSLITGRTPAGSKGLDIHEVKILGKEVFVRIRKKELNW